MKLLGKVAILLFLSTSMAMAQGELSSSRELDRYRLHSFGLKVNTNGYGLLYSFSTRVNLRLRRVVEVELNYLKNHKEIKVVNPYFETLNPRKFVFGKTNFVNNIRLGYGYNRMLFSKSDKNSLSIHLSGTAGCVLAVCKPIYYEVIDSVEYSGMYMIPYTSIHRFDEYVHNNPTDIVGKAPFARGLSEIFVVPGVYLKVGLSFDFSQNFNRTQVLEFGVVAEGYFKKVEIMDKNEKWLLPSVYVSYHFGTKFDPRLNRDYRKSQRKLQHQDS